MELKNLVYWIIFMLCFAPNTWSQDTVKPVKKDKYSRKMAVSAMDLEKSFVEKDEEKIAENYEKIAKEFDAKGDKEKAEEYLKKAQAIYAKRNQTARLNVVSRNLAKNQESQKEYDDAISNYYIAGKNATSTVEEKINSNDAKRLENIENPNVQLGYTNLNIKLADKAENKEEVAGGYLQQAEILATSANPASAIASYNNAILYSSKPSEVIEIKNKIAEVYEKKGDFDKAIDINKKLIVEAEKTKDFSTQIVQLQSLAKVYLKKNESENALVSLKKSYEIAAENGNIDQVKSSLTELINYYKINKNEKERIALYDDFIERFDAIVSKDSSLIDSKNFQKIEEKILQLEKEKSLTDELISRKNRFNYFLIIAVLLLLVLFGLIAKALFAIKKKNKKIALQSLRREMNPHFIFNSLNSVNQFISENNELAANKYLTSYSNLMRTTMEYSNKDFIALSTEVEQLKKYLDLEHLRFQDKFDYQIVVDQTIDTETILVPNMILQPHLENAIWHGLRYLETKGKLELRIEKFDKKLRIIIDDTGIGLTKSAALKTKNQKVHESRGTKNTVERIMLLNDLYQAKIDFKITEKTGDETGTIVEIMFPLIEKNNI